MKRKSVCLLLCIGLLFIPALADAQDRVVPYPAGLDTTSDGASAAPKEINHVPSVYFTMPDVFELVSDKNVTVLTHYPTYQQTTEYSCGPAAALTVLWYYKHQNITEKQLIEKMGTSPKTGTRVKGLADYFRSIGWKVQTNIGTKKTFDRYEKFADFVTEQLKLGHPILVENVSWGGHWRVIIGYDTLGTASTLDDVLIFSDPYDTTDHHQDGYAVENSQQFFWSWFEHKFPRNERYQPFVVAYPAENTEN